MKELRDIVRRHGPNAEQLVRLDILLATINDVDISEFVDKIEPIVARLVEALERKRRLEAQTSATVDQFVRELMEVRMDNGAFEAVIDRLRSNRALKVHDVATIASKFLGGDKKFKSKSEALKAILKRQIGDKRATERRGQISGIF